MQFAPYVDVLFSRPAATASADLSWGALLERFPGLAEAEAVSVTGSIAAGWGNPYSDIDLYAFADREIELPVDKSMELWPGSDPSGLRWTTWIGSYGDHRVDIKVFATDSLVTALAPYDASPEPEYVAKSELVEDFIYRVVAGRPLAGAAFFTRMRALFDASAYRRVRARALKLEAENALVDLAGQLEIGDVLAARVSAMRAAAFAADCCLVLHGEVCRREKWLLRRLAATPQSGITADEYRAAVLDGPLHGESEAEYALRVGRWTQDQLVRTEDEVLVTARR